MSNLIMILADILVAILLGVTIATSIKLSKRIAGLKADESAMRQTIGNLVAATASAERAIGGLRSTLDECDRTLTERLEAGRRVGGELAAHVAAGESVVARIGAIVAQSREAAAAALETRPDPRMQDRRAQDLKMQDPRRQDPLMQDPRRQDPRMQDPRMQDLRLAVPRAAKVVAPEPVETLSSGERINATLAAARALSERALERVRARAA